MNGQFLSRRLSTILLGGTCLMLAVAIPALLCTTARAEDRPAATKPAKVLSIKGTCTFGGKDSTWSAKLTPKGDGTYDAVYVSTWGGKPLNYVGTIKTDLKAEISGTGKASGGSANGTFEFTGKFGEDGVAKCSYTEVGGKRKGAMTAEMPK